MTTLIANTWPAVLGVALVVATYSAAQCIRKLRSYRRWRRWRLGGESDDTA